MLWLELVGKTDVNESYDNVHQASSSRDVLHGLVCATSGPGMIVHTLVCRLYAGNLNAPRQQVLAVHVLRSTVCICRKLDALDICLWHLSMADVHKALTAVQSVRAETISNSGAVPSCK